MPAISLLIKPASSLCNLRCKYCFYHSIAENRLTQSYGIMSIETLEELIKKALEYADYQCTFAFQGGEPTLAGLDFYRCAVRFTKKYNTKKIPVHFALQTNGLAIDRSWAEFLSENHFLVGLSLDGYKDTNDAMRVDPQGNGSYNRIMDAARMFNEYNIIISDSKCFHLKRFCDNLTASVFLLILPYYHRNFFCTRTHFMSI